MSAAPTGDETLTPNDAVKVLEELLPAKNHSHMLGLKLGLPLHDVEGIQSNYHDPRDRLLKVISEFLKQEQTGPTWRVIVDALRSPVVNLPALAKRVEAAHFPDSISTRDVVPETTTGMTPLNYDWSNSVSIISAAESVASTTTDTSGDVVKSKTPSQLTSGEKYLSFPCHTVVIVSTVTEVKDEIKGFRRRFKSLKQSVIQCLERCRIAVMTVVYMLTEIRAIDQHKVFLEERHKSLRQCEDHWELFGMLNFYWNYLSPDLLDQLLEELILEESSFEAIGQEMEKYKTDLQKFRQRTTLKLFCQADTSTECDPPPEFRKIVVKHEWSKTVTLEDVEKFRHRYAQAYNLQNCAMMLNQIGTGSFTVTWFVPVTVIDILRKKRAVKVYKEFKVSRLEIYVQSTAVCVYQTPVQQQVSFMQYL